jgi:hypothetical protein
LKPVEKCVEDAYTDNDIQNDYAPAKITYSQQNLLEEAISHATIDAKKTEIQVKEDFEKFAVERVNKVSFLGSHQVDR